MTEIIRLITPDESRNTPESFASSKGALMYIVYIGHNKQSIAELKRQNNFFPASESTAQKYAAKITAENVRIKVLTLTPYFKPMNDPPGIITAIAIPKAQNANGNLILSESITGMSPKITAGIIIASSRAYLSVSKN